MITTASQQGLDLTGKIFLDPGDNVIVGLPSYLGGLSAFRSYGGEMTGIRFDKDGMNPVALEEKLSELRITSYNVCYTKVITDCNIW